MDLCAEPAVSGRSARERATPLARAAAARSPQSQHRRRAHPRDQTRPVRGRAWRPCRRGPDAPTKGWAPRHSWFKKDLTLVASSSPAPADDTTGMAESFSQYSRIASGEEVNFPETATIL